MRTALAFATLAVTALTLAISVSPARAGEEPFIVPPEGWQPLPLVKERNLTVARMLPPGATSEHFDEAINVERYDEYARSPKEYVLGAVEKLKQSCEGVQVSPVDDKPINNYQAASLRIACTKSIRTGHSGLMMITAIAGKHALYVTKRIWFGPPVAPNEAVPVPQQMVAAWDAFAGTINLCDTGDSNHPCPVRAN